MFGYSGKGEEEEREEEQEKEEGNEGSELLRASADCSVIYRQKHIYMIICHNQAVCAAYSSVAGLSDIQI